MYFNRPYIPTFTESILEKLKAGKSFVSILKTIHLIFETFTRNTREIFEKRRKRNWFWILYLVHGNIAESSSQAF